MRKKKHRYRLFWLLLLIIVCFAAVKTEVLSSERFPSFSLLAEEEATQSRHGLEGMTARQVLLKERGGEIIYDKNSQQPVAIASLTKIMTTICLLELFPDRQQPVSIPEEIFPYIWQEELATAGFLQGETVTMNDLLYGIMLPSGADAALAAAIYAMGTEQSFVEKMNQKAEALEMRNSHFSNVTGADDSNHYSTAADMLKLLEYALENPVFYELFTSLTHETEGTAEQPNGILLTSTLLRSEEALGWNGGEIIGGKTGYTVGAGQCLASLATSSGQEYLMILLGAKGSPEKGQFNIRESRQLYQQLIK